MTHRIMQTIAILVIIILLLAVLTLPLSIRKRVQRRIDKIISQSVFQQLSFLLFISVAAFSLLLLFMMLLHGTVKLNVSDWILAFINPGTSYAQAEKMGGVERAWALIMGLIGLICMSGLLISVISNIMERRVESVKNGKVYYYFKNHIVIIGYNQMTIGLIGQLAKDNRYSSSEIVLQTTQEVTKVRHELSARLTSVIEKSVTIVSGNRTAPEDLQRLYIHLCREVFILGENNEVDNDSRNMECIRNIHTIFSKKSVDTIIRCHVRLEHPSIFALFQRHNVDRLKDRIDFVPFNYNEMWAQKIFVDGEYESLAKEPLNYTPLDRDGIDAESDKKVHLVVVGMTDMGVVMGMEAAHLCHFPNFITKGIKTRITFIDEEADQKMNLLRGRYRALFNETELFYREENRSELIERNRLVDKSAHINKRSTHELFTDIEFEFIKADVTDPAIQEYLADLSCNQQLYLTVAVCYSSPHQALSTGLYLPDELYDHHIPVIIQQEIPYCTLDLIDREGRYKNVKPFGMVENCYHLSQADDRIPMMLNYVYSKGIPESFPEEEMVTMWRTLGTSLQWSNRYHADSIKYKLRSFHKIDDNEPFTDQQIDLLARVEHNRWNIEKLLMGYRPTTMLEKEAVKRDLSMKKEFKIDRFAHHDITPYDHLMCDETGVNVREYDRIISASLLLMVRDEQRQVLKP